MNTRIVSGHAVTMVCVVATLFSGCRVTPQSGIAGKWRSADGSYVVEFQPGGICSARYRLHGRDLGGACIYTVDKDDIKLRWKGPVTNSQSGGSEMSATWHYALSGDVLNVSVFGNSLALQRVH
jgi:hypothetical protein